MNYPGLKARVIHSEPIMGFSPPNKMPDAWSGSTLAFMKEKSSRSFKDCHPEMIGIARLFKQFWLLIFFFSHPLHFRGLSEIHEPRPNGLPSHYFNYLF